MDASRFDVRMEPVEIGSVTARNRFFQVPHCKGMGYRDVSAHAEMRAVMSHPVSCRLVVDATWLPAQNGPDGDGSAVEREVERRVLGAVTKDDWMAEHPPMFEWDSSLVPGEVGPAPGLVVTGVWCLISPPRGAERSFQTRPG